MEKLTAGPELDERIAGAIMGPKCNAWRIVDYGGWHGEAVWMKDEGACEHEKCRPRGSPPCYSTNMRYAGWLLDKLFEWATQQEPSEMVTLICCDEGHQCKTGGCRHGPSFDGWTEYASWQKDDEFYDTPELAICAAALEYLQGEQ